MRKAAGILLLLAAKALAAPTCNNCVPPFAQGCYNGDGTDDRVITSNITNPGLFLIKRLDLNTPKVMTVRFPEFVGDFSCQLATGGTFCAANRVQAVSTNGTFTVGTDQLVNESGFVYCWYNWQLGDGFHGTFSYVGNGISPRTIDLGQQPDFALVLLPSDESAAGKQHFYMRPKDAPANTSYGWYLASEPARTQLIRDFVATGIVVGSDANESGKTYYLAWWKEQTGYGDSIKWIGNGNSAGGGCATGLDHQTIAAACDVRNVIITGCTSAFCEGGTCHTQGGDPQGLRGQNVGSAIVGPGHISGDDYYVQGGELGDLDGLVGVLAGMTFDVIGGTTFQGSSNDLNQASYGWVTCAPAPGLCP